jgi:hypothetical protein
MHDLESVNMQSCALSSPVWHHCFVAAQKLPMIYGQFYRHAGAFAGPALGRNRAPISFHQRLYDGQSESETACGAVPRRVSAVEAFENSW